jgi:hypothetical protein
MSGIAAASRNAFAPLASVITPTNTGRSTGLALGFRRDLLTAAAYGVDQFLFVYGDKPTSAQLRGRDKMRLRPSGSPWRPCPGPRRRRSRRRFNRAGGRPYPPVALFVSLCGPLRSGKLCRSCCLRHADRLSAQLVVSREELVMAETQWRLTETYASDKGRVSYDMVGQGPPLVLVRLSRVPWNFVAAPVTRQSVRQAGCQ